MDQNNSTTKNLYGYFSQKIFSKYGGYIYLDKNLREILTTSVLNKQCDLFLYDDEKYVGIVMMYVRRVAEGPTDAPRKLIDVSINLSEGPSMHFVSKL